MIFKYFTIMVIIIKMQQIYEKKITLGYLFCSNSYRCDYFCIQEKCIQPPVVCSQVKCDCSSAHQKCSKKPIKQIEAQLTKIHGKAYTQHRQSLQYIEATYDELIQSFSLKRQAFMNFTQTFGLGPNSISFIKTINQQNKQQIKRKSILEALRQINQSPKQPVYTIIDNVKKTKTKLKKDLQVLCNELKQYQYHTFESTLDSKILSIYSQDLIRKSGEQTLRRFLGPKVSKMKLVFRASQHQFLAKAFHQHCDNLKNTIVLVQTQFQKIIGGYNNVSWGGGQSLSAEYVQDLSNKSFLFSLTLNQKFELINRYCAIQHYGQAGPIFGNDDLSISNKCNENYCDGDILKIYGKTATRTQQTYKNFSGQTMGSKFLVKQYEIYQVQWIQ